MGTKQRSSDGGGQVIHAVVGSCGYLELPLADPEVIHLKSIRLGGLIPELKIIEDRQISDVLYSSLRILELEAACFRGELEETPPTRRVQRFTG